jgi:hypothetical protein
MHYRQRSSRGQLPLIFIERFKGVWVNGKCCFLLLQKIWWRSNRALLPEDNVIEEKRTKQLCRRQYRVEQFNRGLTAVRRGTNQRCQSHPWHHVCVSSKTWKKRRPSDELTNDNEESSESIQENQRRKKKYPKKSTKKAEERSLMYT